MMSALSTVELTRLIAFCMEDAYFLLFVDTQRLSVYLPLLSRHRIQKLTKIIYFCYIY